MMRQHQQMQGNGNRIPTHEPLVDSAGAERRPRGLLAGMNDEELAGYAEWLMDSLGICSRTELKVVDSGVYNALLRRQWKRWGVMEKVGFEEKRRDWDSLSNEDLIGHAREFMKKKGIRTKEELYNADNGLHQALRKRENEKPGVMGKVGFERKRREMRDWKAMDDDELVARAQEFVKERGISGRTELNKIDSGMYDALLRRKNKSPGIMERAFSIVEFSKHGDAVNGVIGALDTFGDEK